MTNSDQILAALSARSAMLIADLLRQLAVSEARTAFLEQQLNDTLATQYAASSQEAPRVADQR